MGQSGFDELLEIMDRLLGENGCPWDKVQTHASLRQYLIEECYEVIEEINLGNDVGLCEELGDVLLQVVFHAKIADSFTIDDVTRTICQKMISRHTHIFADDKAETPEDVLNTWEKNKKVEKGYKSETEVLRKIPMSLPALMRAEKVQKKASKASMDFADIDAAFDKVYEELDELKTAMKLSESQKIEEMGDVLFSVVNISRFLKINPEFALTNAIEKFINRFGYVENAAISCEKNVSELSFDEMDSFWNESKKIVH